MKYVVFEGMNKFESGSRNARKHISNTTENYIRVETKSGKFVCEAWRYADGTINVNAKE